MQHGNGLLLVFEIFCKASLITITTIYVWLYMAIYSYLLKLNSQLAELNVGMCDRPTLNLTVTASDVRARARARVCVYL